MANININQIFRNGIYLNEFDNSILTSNIVEGMRVLVIGSSRKGPINTPVELNSKLDLERIFGIDDRNLERNGSYFHRTISKILESTPVYAINLLKTSDVLDRLEYKSLSTTTSKSNGLDTNAPYRRFFNTTGFWTRDTESFISLTKDSQSYNDAILNITNMGDRPITVFIFKSRQAGYDRPISEWYSNINDVPPYISPTDYASDYLVDVIVVAGDFTNYQELSIDSRFTNYFSTNGLLKNQVDAFYNDRNVTQLAYYSGLSLVPHFRDASGRVIYIESVINQDTNKTGLFCAYNVELLSQEYNTGLIDLVGNNLVGDDSSEINFLSYKDTITESFNFTHTELDRVGNTLSVGDTLSSGTRTNIFAEGNINGTVTITQDGVLSRVNVAISPNAYAIIGGNEVPITSDAFDYDFSIPTQNTNYYSYVYLTSTGIVSFSPLSTNNNPNIIGNITLLGMLTLDDDGTDITIVYNNTVPNKNTGIIITALNSVISLEFNNTTSSTPVYNNYEILKHYNLLKSYLTSSLKNNGTLLLDDNTKLSLSNVVVSFVEVVSSNLKINIDTININDNNLSTDHFTIYKSDDELIFRQEMVTTNNLPTSTMGIIGKQSSLYQRYYNGIINSGDYFFKNVITGDVNVEFDTQTTTIKIEYNSIAPVINASDIIKFKNAIINTGEFFVTSVVDDIVNDTMTLEVEQNFESETIFNETAIFNVEEKYYIKCFLNADNMELSFVDEAGAINYDPTIETNGFDLISNLSNYKESIDIIIPNGYERQPNKILISASRYTSVRLGDFLERNWGVVEIDGEEIPQAMPKKLTRIISKKVYALDNTLVEITCDADIKLYDNKQAMKYSTIESYVRTYKGIKLRGFKLRKDSLPDGTESRQSEILDLVAKGSPLYKSITNKESFDFRYLVDSYGLGLTERSKQHYVDICGERLDCFAFISMPSAKQFKNSSSPSFVNDEDVLQAEYISIGGNPESNPAFLYSFGTGQGASAVGYFFPYVQVNDGGTPTYVPPAMYIADTYLRKYNSANSNVVPWTIAAGTTNGRVINITDTEMTFGNDDLDWFAKAQMNPIVYKKNRGFVIDSQRTAQVMYKSALSYIHTREVLIELEREIADMLKDYQYGFNTEMVRQEIKLKADSICEKYQNKNGLYTFFNKCDSENNTPDLIDQGIAILDTYVEVIKGMEIIVNNVTIMRTGGIQSAGFISSTN